jgi:hypothetical protein
LRIKGKRESSKLQRHKGIVLKTHWYWENLFLIHLLNKYSLRAYLPGTLPGTGDTQ